MASAFTSEQQEEILLEYFAADEADGAPLCPSCGETLGFRSAVASFFGLQVDISCQGCGGGFTWCQPVPEKPWKELHLHYFVERHRRGEIPHCPFDDCQVSCAEFEGNVLEFICPYCNRRGRGRVDEDDAENG